MKIYVLDTFALLAYARKEVSGDIVRDLLVQGKDEKIGIAMSAVNVGEFFYMYYKKSSPTKAYIFWRHIPQMGTSIYEGSLARSFAAAQLKAQYSTSKQQLSYADCFAAALAQELNATIVTGDPEFQTLSSIINIQFLPK